MPVAARPIRTIMVPLDGSEFSEQALPTACAIADESGARLRLVHVHQSPSLPLDPASASSYTTAELVIRMGEGAYLQKVRAQLRWEGRVVSAMTVRGGVVAPALIEHAREIEADLVVMATHGRGPLQRFWLGSVADGMVRASDVPVLLVRPKEGESRCTPAHLIHRILVPLDGSPLAEQALSPAGALAQAVGAELDLVQVVRPVLPGVDPAIPLPSSHGQELTAHARARAQGYLHGVAEHYRQRGIGVCTSVGIGLDPIEVLLERARAPQYDVLALATHGRGGVRRLALGSVADKLVRAAEIPVLVYRPVKRPGSAPRRRAIVRLGGWSTPHSRH